MRIISIKYFIYNHKIIQAIQRDFLYAIKVVEKIFKVEFNELTLIVAKNKTHYDELLKMNRPSWGVTTQKMGMIYIYDPFQWKRKITGHNLSDLKPSLIHELVHVFFYNYHIQCPIWLEEGLAVIISDENKGKKKDAFFKLLSKYPIPEVLNTTSNYKKKKGKLPLIHYLTFFMFVSHLLKLCGINKFIEFIMLQQKESSFEDIFEKFFNQTLHKLWSDFRDDMNLALNNNRHSYYE